MLRVGLRVTALDSACGSVCRGRMWECLWVSARHLCADGGPVLTRVCGPLAAGELSGGLCGQQVLRCRVWVLGARAGSAWVFTKASVQSLGVEMGSRPELPSASGGMRVVLCLERAWACAGGAGMGWAAGHCAFKVGAGSGLSLSSAQVDVVSGGSRGGAEFPRLSAGSWGTSLAPGAPAPQGPSLGRAPTAGALMPADEAPGAESCSCSAPREQASAPGGREL